MIGGFIAGLPPAKVDPSVLRIRDAAFAGTNAAEVRQWSARRSTLRALRGNRTPIYLMQGRRDFAFGLDQATRLYGVLRGPKRLWIGNHGHPAVDVPGGGHRDDARGREALVRPLPPRGGRTGSTGRGP